MEGNVGIYHYCLVFCRPTNANPQLNLFCSSISYESLFTASKGRTINFLKGWWGLDVILGTWLFFFSSPLSFARYFLLGSSLWKNFFKVKHRTWIVETESTCSILSPRRPMHNLFLQQSLLCKIFYGKLSTPTPPPPLKKSGPFLSLILLGTSLLK